MSADLRSMTIDSEMKIQNVLYVLYNYLIFMITRFATNAGKQNISKNTPIQSYHFIYLFI